MGLGLRISKGSRKLPRVSDAKLAYCLDSDKRIQYYTRLYKKHKQMTEIYKETPDNPEEENGSTRRLRIADERLDLIEDKVLAQHNGETGAGIDRMVDISLKDLVKQTQAAWEDGTLSTEKAQDMLLIALEKIDEYKDDEDPGTNGEIIAGALAGLPNELLGGALQEFLLAEGSAETVEILSEITRNKPNIAA